MSGGPERGRAPAGETVETILSDFAYALVAAAGCDPANLSPPIRETAERIAALRGAPVDAERLNFEALFAGWEAAESDAEVVRFANSWVSSMLNEIAALRGHTAAPREPDRYELLRQAVNESTNECKPGCDSYGHDEGCPACDPARWLEDQQAEINRLRASLAAAAPQEADGWRPIESAPKDAVIFVRYRQKEFSLAQIAGWEDDLRCWWGYATAGVIADPTHWFPLPPSPVPQEAE